MSLYIEGMNEHDSRLFKLEKKRFKKNKPCANCGRKLSKELMTVDHIIPVYLYSGSIFYKGNWQVLCIQCHTEKNRKECAEAEERKREYELEKEAERIEDRR